jgi:predicted DNA-binding transcriptional regulator AlpA
MPEPKTMTLAQIAQYIGVGRKTLYRMLCDGRFAIDPIPETKPRRWATDDINAWINKN